MLNNTIYKDEFNEVLEIVRDQAVTQLDIAETSAANSPRFNQGERAARSIRRERRNNQASSAARWRVSLW